MSRVLLGNLEPIVRIGISAVLCDEGIEVVGSEERPRPLLRLAERLRPDAVVLDRSSRDLAARVRAASPGTTVVLWDRDEVEMEVVGPAEVRRIVSPSAAQLCAELGADALSLRRGSA